MVFGISQNVFSNSVLLMFAAAAKWLQSCPTLCDPGDGSPPAPPSLGFSRQEHWNGFLFPSPMHESESEVTQSCPTPSDPMDCSLPGPSVQGFARQEYWNGLPLLMFGAWQMEIPPGYNFLLFPIGRLWERAGEGCSACSSDLSSSH